MAKDMSRVAAGLSYNVDPASKLMIRNEETCFGCVADG